MTTTDKKFKSPYLIPIIILVSIIALCVGIWSYITWTRNNHVDTIIILDSESSILLQVNAKENVISASGLNNNGAAVLEDMKLENVNLDVAINAIVGAMMRKGYLDEMQNSILVSVQNKDAKKSAQLQARISSNINSIFAKTNSNKALLDQSVNDISVDNNTNSNNTEASSQAGDISADNNTNPNNTEASSQPKDVSSNTNMPTNDNANASTLAGATNQANTTNNNSSYISKDSAVEIACTHAGVTVSSIAHLKAKLDHDDGITVYEIEFYVGNIEYDYDVDALSGQIIKYNSENKGTAASAATSDIGAEAAKNAALSHAGLNASQVTKLKADYDIDDGYARYEVEFDYNGYEYEFEIDASNGSILKYEIDH